MALAPATLDEWLAGGERVRVGRFDLFRHVSGSGPWLTLLHGFPTSSWDWAKVADALGPRHRLLAFDFLGFGDSDKPRDHDYSIHEQANLTQALWNAHGVDETGLVAHDYGVSVAQELLARRREGRLGTRLTGVLFMNGGLFPAWQRPRTIQKLLLNPLVGPWVARFLGEARFRRSFGAIFSSAHPPAAEELAQHWRALERRGGARIAHRVIRYLRDRRTHRGRWEGALDGATVPLRFVWGLADPVSGAPMASEIRRRRPPGELVELPEVGHYPQLEVPEIVAGEIASFLGRVGSRA